MTLKSIHFLSHIQYILHFYIYIYVKLLINIFINHHTFRICDSQATEAHNCRQLVLCKDWATEIMLLSILENNIISIFITCYLLYIEIFYLKRV